jgi:hypothetical protein
MGISWLWAEKDLKGVGLNAFQGNIQATAWRDCMKILRTSVRAIGYPTRILNGRRPNVIWGRFGQTDQFGTEQNYFCNFVFDIGKYLARRYSKGVNQEITTVMQQTWLLQSIFQGRRWREWHWSVLLNNDGWLELGGKQTVVSIATAISSFDFITSCKFWVQSLQLSRFFYDPMPSFWPKA